MLDRLTTAAATVAAYFDDPYWTETEVHNVGVFLAWTGGILLAVWTAALIPGAIRETRAAREHNARVDAAVLRARLAPYTTAAVSGADEPTNVATHH